VLSPNPVSSISGICYVVVAVYCPSLSEMKREIIEWNYCLQFLFLRALFLFICFPFISMSKILSNKEKYCSISSDFIFPSVTIPTPQSESGIGQIFSHLSSISSVKPSIIQDNERERRNQTNCYYWKCQSLQSNEKTCFYCLPNVFVAGFSKCGTTALCSKLILHPDIKPYRKKEINIFTKYFDEFKWEQFEKRVYDTHPEVTSIRTFGF
jgi:hypothetical protein